MRFIALIGLGLPVLTVSGAVAYGSIQQIATALESPQPALIAAAPAMATAAGDVFVNASLSDWSVSYPEQAPVQVAVSFEDTAPRGQVEVTQDREHESNTESFQTAVVTDREVSLPRASVAKPKIVLSTGKAKPQKPEAEVKKVKPGFRMPWQTGVFQ
jgi:hypothetical protein